MCCEKWTRADYIQLTYLILWSISIPLFVLAMSFDTLVYYKTGTWEWNYGWEKATGEFPAAWSSYSGDYEYCKDFPDSHIFVMDKDKWDSLCDDGKIYVAFACISALVGGVTLAIDYAMKCCCTAGACARKLIFILYCCSFAGMVLTVIIIFGVFMPNAESETFKSLGDDDDAFPGTTPIIMIISLVLSGIALVFNFCFGCCCGSEAGKGDVAL